MDRLTPESLSQRLGIRPHVAKRIASGGPFARPEAILRPELLSRATAYEIDRLAVELQAAGPIELEIRSEEELERHGAAVYGVERFSSGDERIVIKSNRGVELISVGMRPSRSRKGSPDQVLDLASIRFLSLRPWELGRLSPASRRRAVELLHGGAGEDGSRLWEDIRTSALSPEDLRAVHLASQVLSFVRDLTQPVQYPAGEEDDCSGSNGCTSSPDFNFGECCDEHDRCYCRGCTEADRVRCDKALFGCISGNAGPVLAYIYYRAVRSLGSSHFNYCIPEGGGEPEDLIEPGDEGSLCHVKATLIRVEYTGQDVGNDISYQAAVQGRQLNQPETGFDPGTSRNHGRVLYEGDRGDCNGRFALDFSANVKEHDAVVDDIGSAQDLAWFDCPGTYRYVLTVKAEEAGDWFSDAVARFRFIFEIEASCRDERDVMMMAERPAYRVITADSDESAPVEETEGEEHEARDDTGIPDTPGANG